MLPPNATVRTFRTVQLVLWAVRLSVIAIVLFVVTHAVGGL
jgi:hypothetical protein